MNLNDESPDVEREAFGGVQRFWHIGRRLGGELLGATMFEVQPGYRGPYHLHYGNEEWVLVVDGTPTLRSPDGERVLQEGDIAVFPRGEAGLHALDNPSDGPARYVVFSSMVDPDVTERPEEGLVGVFAGAVPTMARDAPFEHFFPLNASKRG
jgi:uncharacterized cupin superfamily protein